MDKVKVSSAKFKLCEYAWCNRRVKGEGGFPLTFWKVLKCVLVTLICLMLVSSFAGSGLVSVQASGGPWGPWDEITLYAVETTNPYWGYYGGYRDIWQAIRAELAKIGINLEIIKYDDFGWYARCFDPDQWNRSYDEGGWDMFIQEWWMMPTGLLWLEPLVYSWMTPYAGYNIFPYNNSRSDELLWKGMHTLDATERKYYLWKWQEELMHNPPIINLYYPRPFEVVPDWVEGWDPVVRFRDVSHLSINVTAMPEARNYLHTDWIYYAVTDEVWQLLPLFMQTCTEQWMGDLQFETLYDLSIDPWPQTGQEPPPRDFYSKPALAAEPPILMDGPNGPNTRARVLLRQNVKWSDGDPFDATDVKFTFDIIPEPPTGATARGDIVPVIESVEIVNETCVDFILYEPYADLATLLSNDRGLAIMPYHIFKDIPPVMIKGHPGNTDFDDPSWWAPVTGPFKLKEIVAGEYALLERNPLYFGYNASIVGSPAWGPDSSVQAIYLKTVSDPAVRLLELQTYMLDLDDYPTGPKRVWKKMEKDPFLRVWQYDRPSSNPIWFNFDNPYLSNIWIRKAIAHAIPHRRIISSILPSWGIETAYPGKTLITPLHYYTDANNVTVHLFNEDLKPFHHSIEKALDYMEMWWYSANPPYTEGPVGDSDLSGLVDLDDYLIFNENLGVTASWPIDVVPGNMIDPDFNNDNIVTAADFQLWATNHGKEYPFPGAR